jgi:hypothetical protein
LLFPPGASLCNCVLWKAWTFSAIEKEQSIKSSKCGEKGELDCPQFGQGRPNYRSAWGENGPFFSGIETIFPSSIESAYFCFENFATWVRGHVCHFSLSTLRSFYQMIHQLVRSADLFCARIYLFSPHRISHIQIFASGAANRLDQRKHYNHNTTYPNPRP